MHELACRAASHDGVGHPGGGRVGQAERARTDRGRCNRLAVDRAGGYVKAAPSCCGARLGGLPGVIDGAHADMPPAGLAGSDGAPMPNRANPRSCRWTRTLSCWSSPPLPSPCCLWAPPALSAIIYNIPCVAAMSRIVSELVARNGSHDAEDRLRWSPALGSNATAIGTSDQVMSLAWPNVTGSAPRSGRSASTEWSSP